MVKNTDVSGLQRQKSKADHNDMIVKKKKKNKKKKKKKVISCFWPPLLPLKLVIILSKAKSLVLRASKMYM